MVHTPPTVTPYPNPTQSSNLNQSEIWSYSISNIGGKIFIIVNSNGVNVQNSYTQIIYQIYR